MLDPPAPTRWFIPQQRVCELSWGLCCSLCASPVCWATSDASSVPRGERSPACCRSKDTAHTGCCTPWSPGRKYETGSQSLIGINGNGRLGLKQQLVLGHSGSTGRGQAVCQPWSPQKQDTKSRKTACQVCHVRGLLQGVEAQDTPELETPAEGHRADGAGSTALCFRWRPAVLDQDY